jgi:hypothetical protein
MPFLVAVDAAGGDKGFKLGEWNLFGTIHSSLFGDKKRNLENLRRYRGENIALTNGETMIFLRHLNVGEKSRAKWVRGVEF